MHPRCNNRRHLNGISCPKLTIRYGESKSRTPSLKDSRLRIDYLEITKFISTQQKKPSKCWAFLFGAEGRT